MKRIVLLITVTFAFVTAAFSQEFFGGLILGGTTSQIGGDGRGGYNKIGIAGGVFAGLDLSQDLDVQMELKYIQKGALSTDVENRPVYDPFRIQVDYVEMPVVFGYNLNKVNVNNVNLRWLKFEFGLCLDVLVRTRQEIQGVPVSENDMWNKFVVNTILGVRVDVKENLAIGLRTINSMTSICDSFKYQYSNGNVTYTRRLFPYYGMFNDVLQLALFWKIL